MNINTQEKIPLLIDTDPGHDDVLALLMLIKSEKFDIKAITTVAGNSTIENVTRNVFFTLDLLNRRNIPVFSGKEKPLQRELIQAVVHGTSGLDGVDTSLTKFRLTGNASEKIVEIVKQNPGNITFLTLGPLTNIARAFMSNPEIISLINEIIIMGGAINVPGNKNRVAEFNIFVDPEAAKIVFESKVKKTLIPIDLCNNVLVSLKEFEILRDMSLYMPIMNMMKQFIAGIEKDEGIKAAIIYDAVAAYFLLNPSVFNIIPMDVVVETIGEFTSGMTVVEKRQSKITRTNIDVALEVIKGVFMKDFFQILRK